ncbi:hypothetical protein HMPREF9318_01650 [Streptococcus urinalis FB127-CNA-2]|uniref:Acetyltransferase, GNAT family n=1 Tax=Streptococcus urinalis 2285-97 TaxID=764291 RepID=G5KF54_9STRE|nr:GNAT family protein [Streptococcus urinalis]EHJ57727.1 acetyltransferase, GNAT family [Streptococcus urinalis 2285-97]EKS18151.1 hypothetical protein HMPREF9318_01650 [Streptococcus urinalis FB127-CNA-2]VEF33024.1 acetyltransferase [Streptococcus urinalis]
MAYNQFGQPIGQPINHFQKGQVPQFDSIKGKTVTVEKVKSYHLNGLFDLFGQSTPEQSFTYMSFEPFKSKEAFQGHFNYMLTSQDSYFLVIIDNQSQQIVGSFSLMRIDPNFRVVEMGWVFYSPQLQASKMATEAQFLVMQYVFENLKYRRYEWKCDSLNQASKNAAKRLGFSYEGTFRQALVYKNRNRDTDWFSILDKEWPNQKERFIKWLDDSNFDENGKQKKSLQDL